MTRDRGKEYQIIDPENFSEEGAVTGGLDDAPAKALDGWIENLGATRLEPGKRSRLSLTHLTRVSDDMSRPCGRSAVMSGVG